MIALLVVFVTLIIVIVRKVACRGQAAQPLFLNMDTLNIGDADANLLSI